MNCVRKVEIFPKWKIEMGFEIELSPKFFFFLLNKSWKLNWLCWIHILSYSNTGYNTLHNLLWSTLQPMAYSFHKLLPFNDQFNRKVYLFANKISNLLNYFILWLNSHSVLRPALIHFGHISGENHWFSFVFQYPIILKILMKFIKYRWYGNDFPLNQFIHNLNSIRFTFSLYILHIPFVFDFAR